MSDADQIKTKDTDAISSEVRAVMKRGPKSARRPSREEQLRLAQKVGERLRESREFSGYSQNRAAVLLGYSNSSRLAKIEQGYSTQIPLWVMKKAAQVYQVSLDYLLGNSECMEPEDRAQYLLRDTIALMREDWERQRWRDMLVTGNLARRVGYIESQVVALEREARTAAAALEAFAAINPGWEDMRGGAPLAASIARTNCHARTAVSRLLQYRQEARMARGSVEQMPLDVF